MTNKIARRKFISQSGVLLGTSFLSNSLVAKGLSNFQIDDKKNTIGSWSFTQNELPFFEYKAQLPFVAFDKNGKDADLPEDPFFLLGNYRIGLITHASGIYQLLTAERVWARMNASEQTNYGSNDASIIFKNNLENKKIELIGLQSLAANNNLVKKCFGVGFAKYNYQLDNQITCTRIISVKPSKKINTGNASFVVTVILKNNGEKEQALAYTERMGVNFVLNGTQYTAPEIRPIIYSPKIAAYNNLKIA
ncbi:MAG: hypothetical protein H7068_11360, partial [Pedobacter sp.]|nr:hypothetical protein [Chitinophagaceae bacterium]